MVCELRGRYKLSDLLKIARLSKSTFFHNLNNIDRREHKDDETYNYIKTIFDSNYRKYGSPRITQELKNRGLVINHKRVERVMKEHHLSASSRPKKYHSYRGEVGVKAPNLIKRHFDNGRPYRIFGTDVTQFSIPCGKLYLSPIIDFHTREIVAYDISEHPNLNQIKRMMNKLEYDYGEELFGAILHSDQGWQYQQKWYQDKLEELGMLQSMSRKGNCLDNSPTENFFGRLKEEMFYGHEWKYESLSELKRDIVTWIDYYNNERIVTCLKDSPLRYKAKLVLMKT